MLGLVESTRLRCGYVKLIHQIACHAVSCKGYKAIAGYDKRRDSTVPARFVNIHSPPSRILPSSEQVVKMDERREAVELVSGISSRNPREMAR